MSENVSQNPLPKRQEQAAQLSADDVLTDVEIAAKVGITERTLYRWRLDPAFVERVGFHRAELAAAILAEGIANKQNRIGEYNERWQLLRDIRAARAADSWVADVPGGPTGLIVKQLRQVKHTYEPDPEVEGGKTVVVTVDTWEAAIDTGYLREMRELEKQAAQEKGDWVEKSNLNVAGGLTQQIEFVGDAVEGL